MPELETPPVTEQPPGTPPITPTSVTDAAGKLVDNWQTHAPEGYEDLREDKTLPRFKSIWDFGKSYVDVRKKVPLDKMARPNDTWGDSDWEEFHVAGGRPDTKEDYQIKRHEEIPEAAMTQELIDGYQELFHKIGLSKKQVEAISAHNSELMLKQIKDTSQAQEDETNKVLDNLRKLWGLATDQNIHRGNVAIDKDKDIIEDPAYKARLLEKVNKDPDLIRFASNMGYKFVEHKIIEDPGIPTPGDLQTQITEIMADPRYSNKDPEVRQPLIDKVLMLRRKLNESKPA